MLFRSLRGRLGFPNSALELAHIRDAVREMTGALHVRVKNHTIPADDTAAVEAADTEDRDRLERRVIETLVSKDARYETRTEDVSTAVVGAKRMALTDEDPARIADFISQQISRRAK